MTSTVEQGEAIVAGYFWSIRIEADTTAFPVGVAITGHVRKRVEDAQPLATISTGNGGVVRVDDTHIDLIITGDTSKNWTAGDVMLDLVRTDLDPDQYLGFRLTVPVTVPVTRGLT